MRKHLEFKIDVDGEERDFIVHEPSADMQKGATKIKNRAFRDALDSGAMLRSQLNSVLREKGAWDDKKEEDYTSLQKKLFAADKRLSEGGFSLEDAKKLALEMGGWRGEMRELLGERSQLDNMTAEGQMENEAFNYLVSQCLVYNKDGVEHKFFASYEEFLASDESNVAIEASRKLASLIYDIGENYEKSLVENKFLLEYGFVDDDLRFINDEGKFVDREGRLLDEEGRFINTKGEYIDTDGNLLTKDGEYKVEFKGFTDDKGKKIKGKSEDVGEKVIEKKPKKKKSKDVTVDEVAVDEVVSADGVTEK